MSFDDLILEYENLNDTELADEFSLVNAYIHMVWSNVDNETSDRFEVLTQLIQERFVSKHGTSYIFMYSDINKL